MEEKEKSPVSPVPAAGLCILGGSLAPEHVQFYTAVPVVGTAQRVPSHWNGNISTQGHSCFLASTLGFLPEFCRLPGPLASGRSLGEQVLQVPCPVRSQPSTSLTTPPAPAECRGLSPGEDPGGGCGPGALANTGQVTTSRACTFLLGEMGRGKGVCGGGTGGPRAVESSRAGKKLAKAEGTGDSFPGDITGDRYSAPGAWPVAPRVPGPRPGAGAAEESWLQGPEGRWVAALLTVRWRVEWRPPEAGHRESWLSPTVGMPQHATADGHRPTMSCEPQHAQERAAESSRRFKGGRATPQPGHLGEPRTTAFSHQATLKRHQTAGRSGKTPPNMHLPRRPQPCPQHATAATHRPPGAGPSAQENNGLQITPVRCGPVTLRGVASDHGEMCPCEALYCEV